MIGRIFKEAVCVRAWVGEHADNSEALFRADFDPLSLLRWKWFAIARTRLRTTPIRLPIVVGIALGTAVGTCRAAEGHDGAWVFLVLITLQVSMLVVGLVLISILFLLLNNQITQQELWYQVPEWYSFTHRAWFRRTWIVQEVALVRDLMVHCGHDALPWHDLITACVGGGRAV